MSFSYDDPATKGWIVTAMMKLQLHTQGVKTCIEQYTASRDTDI
jgi:hypothetical protein